MDARVVVALAVSLMVVGCASSGAGERRAAELRTSHAICQSAGFVPGQPGYGDCVMQDQNLTEAFAAARRQAESAALIQLGTQLMTPPAAPQACNPDAYCYNACRRQNDHMWCYATCGCRGYPIPLR